MTCLITFFFTKTLFPQKWASLCVCMRFCVYSQHTIKFEFSSFIFFSCTILYFHSFLHAHFVRGAWKCLFDHNECIHMLVTINHSVHGWLWLWLNINIFFTWVKLINTFSHSQNMPKGLDADHTNCTLTVLMAVLPSSVISAICSIVVHEWYV